ncbi:hypothetical protein HC716_05615 [Listeria ivanovii subsp. ivanovii]|nr:hypothetical protein [Listeria ivanovii subsp. ivanovii]
MMQFANIWLAVFWNKPDKNTALLFFTMVSNCFLSSDLAASNALMLTSFTAESISNDFSTIATLFMLL